MTIRLEGLQIYLLVFARMAGLIMFNPLLSRRNIPTQVRAALVLVLKLLNDPLAGSEKEDRVYFDN